jgi:GNAT superfamily N-acetyltransferase
MLIIPPAPARWPALEDLLGHKGPPWITDIRRRMVPGVPGAQDAYAVVPAAGRFLAGVCINKYGDVGVLGHCYTRPDHRRRGLATKVVQTVLSWFDMTGGKWLFLGTTAELDESFYRKFGFAPLRRALWHPYDRLTMWRTAPGAGDDPLAEAAGELTVRDLTRAEWPAMVTLLQYRPGPDPRVPLDESAVNAEVFTLDLIDHQERDACGLIGAFRGPQLVGLATIATERSGERTYGMLIPHTGAPAELRQAVLDFARSKGYTQVDFPMEGLGSYHHGDPTGTQLGCV